MLGEGTRLCVKKNRQTCVEARARLDFLPCRLHEARVVHRVACIAAG